MSRRLTAAAALAVLGVAMLPAVPALASAASTATLVAASQAVYPGADRSFTITVTNNEAPLTGRTINAIQVSLPIGAEITHGSTAGTAGTVPGTKKVVRDASGRVTGQFLEYRGLSLAPGASTNVTFPATVGAPTAKDVTGSFEVLVSSTNFQSNKDAAGNLATKVQVLEILQEGLRPIAPTNADNSKGVTDRSGSAGQTVTYATTVRNYAETALSVTTAISSDLGDKTRTPAVFTVPANGGTNSGNVLVDLGPATADRTTGLVTTATATGATAPTKTDAFTVQAPVTFTLGDLQPNRTSSGDGSGRDFSAAATKRGSQALELTKSTLTFGTTTGSAAPTAFDKGAVDRRLVFSVARVNDADGTLGASAISVAKDDNLADYSYSAALGNIVVDNVAPILGALTTTLPNDADNMKQTAIKNGDTVRVAGSITNAADIAADSLKVVLQPNIGPAQNFTLSQSGSGDSRTFTGSLTAAPFDPKATSFTVAASVVDTAGNTDGEVGAGAPIDNVLPAVVTNGVILKADEIEVTFADTTGVLGGCNPNTYTVNGTPGSVTDVRASDGTECTTTVGGRILTLRTPLEVDQTPEVRYNFNPSTRGLSTPPVKDGAGNTAVSQTIQTVNNLRPQIPTLFAVERRDGAADKPFEPAYLDADDKRYYTNVAGTDALQITVDGIRQNYTLEVLNGATVVASKKFTAAPSSPLASSYRGSITAPLPTTINATSKEGVNALSVRFKALNNLAGPGAPLTVVYETTLPTLGKAVVTASGTDGTSTVSAPFTEKIVGGTNFAEDWFVSETIPTETGTTTRIRNVNTVSGSDLSGRTLNARLLDPAAFLRADYSLESADGVRYEDRAGNLMGDTISVSAS